MEEASTLGFPPQSRRCLLEVLGLLTNTVRVPSDRELRFYLWKRPGTSGSIVEAHVGMWIQSGTTPSKTSQKYNSAHQFLHNFRQDLTLRGARWGLSDRFLYLWLIVGVLGRPLGPPWGTKKSTWDHPGAPSQPDTKSNKKNHFLGTCFEAQI